MNLQLSGDTASAVSFNHFNRHPGGGRGPGFQHPSWLTVWIPAFAGMTEKRKARPKIVLYRHHPLAIRVRFMTMSLDVRRPTGSRMVLT
jgi:hypothetical protein